MSSLETPGCPMASQPQGHTGDPWFLLYLGSKNTNGNGGEEREVIVVRIQAANEEAAREKFTQEYPELRNTHMRVVGA